MPSPETVGGAVALFVIILFAALLGAGVVKLISLMF